MMSVLRQLGKTFTRQEPQGRQVQQSLVSWMMPPGIEPVADNSGRRSVCGAPMNANSLVIS